MTNQLEANAVQQAHKVVQAMVKGLDDIHHEVVRLNELNRHLNPEGRAHLKCEVVSAHALHSAKQLAFSLKQIRASMSEWPAWWATTEEVTNDDQG